MKKEEHKSKDKGKRVRNGKPQKRKWIKRSAKRERDKVITWSTTSYMQINLLLPPAMRNEPSAE